MPTGEAQEVPMEETDMNFLDLEGEREMQAYNILKDRVFVHTPAFDPELLNKIGMDDEFFTIFKYVGWEKIDPVWEEGSRLLTIQFLCTLQVFEHGITVRLFKNEYFITWRDLSIHIGFDDHCATRIDYALKDFNRHQFWNGYIWTSYCWKIFS